MVAVSYKYRELQKISLKKYVLPFRSANPSVLINQIGAPKDFEPEEPNIRFSGG